MEPNQVRVGVIRVVAVLALVLATLAPRLYRLGGSSFWLDESYSVWNSAGTRVGRFISAGRPFRHDDLLRGSVTGPEVLRSIRGTENTPPLYFLLLRLWIGICGSSELAVRSLSVLFAVLTVLLVLFGAAPLFGPRVAWGAAWLLALSPMHIGYSREARNYALAGLLAAATLLLLVRAVRTPAGLAHRRERVRAWAAYAAAAALGLYTNYLMGLILLAQAAALALGPDPPAGPEPAAKAGKPASLLAWAIAAAAAFVAFLPWLIFAVEQQAQDGLAYTDAAWLSSSLRFGAKLLAYLFVGETSLKLAFLALGYLTLPLLALAAFALAGIVRERRKPSLASAPGFIVAASSFLYLPLILMLCLASQTWLLVSPRFSVPILPGLCLALAAGMACAPGRLSRRWPLSTWGVPVMICLEAVLLFSPVSVLVDADRPGEGWRRAARFLAAQERPGDLIVLDGAAGAAPLNVYYQGSLPQLPLTRLVGSHRRIAAAAVAPARRLWLVEGYHRMDAGDLARLLAGFREQERQKFGPAVEVVLLAPVRR